jgi:arylsulfatase A-like enzyme
LAGADTPAAETLDGTSLVPLLEGEELARHVPLYWQYDLALAGDGPAASREGAMKHAVISDTWKVLADGALQRFELFNLQADQAEQVDLSTATPERLSELADRLRQRRAEVDSAQRARFEP